MIDRSTKIILIAIAGGLWANALVHAVRPAAADSYILTSINDNLDSIKIISTNTETSISNIEMGWCKNSKLC
jgi:hypothetical protein